MTAIIQSPPQSHPPRPRPARAFISSVFGGMMDLRAWAGETAELVGYEAVLPERFIAGHESIEVVLARELALADTYVGLFSKRHGTVPGGERWSVSEIEYRTARDLGRRCIALVEGLDDAAREPLLRRFLDEQVRSYKDGVYPAYFKDDDELRLVLAASLAALLPAAHLWIGRGEAGGSVASMVRNQLGPAVGDDRGAIGPLPMGLDLSPVATALLRKFLGGPMERGSLGDADLKYLGRELWAMIPPAIAAALGEAITVLASHGRPLTLVIRTAEPEALALPWELVCPPGGTPPVRSGALEVIRHRLAPGEGPDPKTAATPVAPTREFSVLGFTAEPLEDEARVIRLGAAGLAGDAKLLWEVEQERLLRALDEQLRTGEGSLVLPDTGEASLLALHLKEPTRPTIVHVSCHGGLREVGKATEGTGRSRRVEHVLRLEDDDGRAREVGSDELLAWMRSGPAARPVELLVLSACESAAFATAAATDSQPGGARIPAPDVLPEGRTRSLSDELSLGGALRVLGMQASVSDSGASAFAEAFYRRLSSGAPLTAALSAGRAALRDASSAHEWALPVLQVREHAGPLVAPPALRAATASPLVRARESFKVGGVSYLEQGYVGRRAHDRRLSRAWRPGQGPTGAIVVLHGIGGIGKSTMAARYLERRVQERVRVLAPRPREWTAATLVAELAKALDVALPPGTEQEKADAVMASLVGSVLGIQPTVLLLDNFEDSQHAETGAIMDAALGSLLAGLAIDAGPNLLILVTSRIELELPGTVVEPINIDLGALSPAEARKFKLLNEGLRGLGPAAWEHVMRDIGGHPKALELLGAYVRGKPDRLAGLLDSLDAALAHVDQALAAEKQARGRKLLLDTVVASVPVERLPALDRLCLLNSPLPTAELVAILVADGVPTAAADIAWLRGHGFLAASVASTALAGGDLVHRLVAVRRRSSLREREGEEAEREFHRRVAEHFDMRPGSIGDFEIAAEHWEAAGDRAAALKRINRLAIAMRDAHAYGACVEVATRGLQRFPASAAQAEQVEEAALCITLHDGAWVLGRTSGAQAALERATAALASATSSEAEFLRAAVAMQMSRHAHSRGEVKTATALLDQAVDGFTRAGADRERAVALGDVARLRAQGGDVKGALTLYEDILGIFATLGDRRSRAVTLGDVARLRMQAGDLTGAMNLHEQRLRIFEELRDLRSQAVTLGDVARLRARAGDAKGALELHEVRLRIFERIDDVRERALALGDVACLRADAGEVEEARRLQKERLAVNRGLGDIAGIASALFDLARIDLGAQRWREAGDKLAEAWQLLNRLDRVDGIASVGSLLGQCLAMSGRRAEALAVLESSRQAWLRLGQPQQASKITVLLQQIRRGGPMKG